jgi:hypothetical protein
VLQLAGEKAPPAVQKKPKLAQRRKTSRRN